MPFLTLRRFRFRRKSSDSDTKKKTPTPEPADPLTFNVLNLVSAKPKRTGSTYRSESRDPSAGTDRSGSVYNKLKPDDQDKVVDIESQEDGSNYEFSATQVKEFRKVFNAFDRDGNDSIGTDELGPVLMALGYSPTESDIVKVLSRFDSDSSGDLSFEEYLALMAVWVEEDEIQIIEAFKVFDKSGDGYVTCDELKKALCRFGEKFTEDEADEFFHLIDVNKDGVINYEEFVKYMLSEVNRGPPPSRAPIKT
eukprot:sb/3468680/